ncbi:MAG TPA: regulatory protein RecX [Sunxiuqinia sp.]|nr:regulatory protein RecX [Sunxiuqinia sp.]
MQFNQQQKEAYQKAAILCSKSEKCGHDIILKLKGWELDDDDANAVLDRLIEEKFVDDERFARSFVRDKFRFNKWGKMKIAYQLKAKRVNSTTIEAALGEINDDGYWGVLVEMIRGKNRGLKAANLYDRKAKLMRFAQGRGFETDLIYSAMDEILNV